MERFLRSRGLYGVPEEPSICPSGLMLNLLGGKKARVQASFLAFSLIGLTRLGARSRRLLLHLRNTVSQIMKHVVNRFLWEQNT